MEVQNPQPYQHHVKLHWTASGNDEPFVCQPFDSSTSPTFPLLLTSSISHSSARVYRISGIMSSSYLDKQKAAFTSNIVSAAPKISNKRSLATATSAPATPAYTASKKEASDPAKPTKEKEAPKNVVYSQPAQTGLGVEAFTQVTYVIEFLKKKDDAKTFEEILDYLSQQNAEMGVKKFIAQILKRHDRVLYIPDPTLRVQAWNSGTFIHRPIINVRNKADLIAFLQNKPDAQGISVKDLKDGWPDCEDAINELEDQHKILVTRTKKDNHPKMVWINDATLIHTVDHEFQTMWHKIELPSVDELVRKLIVAGQKPASEDPSKRVKVAPVAKSKKKRQMRATGRTTNTHMAGILKDYSHKKL